MKKTTKQNVKTSVKAGVEFIRAFGAGDRPNFRGMNFIQSLSATE